MPLCLASDIQIHFYIEGDYETSSEGMIPLKRSDTEIRETQTKESLCVYFKNKSTSLSKLVAFNKTVPLIEEEVTSDSSHEFMENRLTREITMKNKSAHVHDNLIFVSEKILAKSKSMPVLKNEISSTSINFKAMDVALISESSFAREKKMSMIVKRMAPVISSTIFLTRDTTINFHGQQHETKKVESRTMPILCDTTPTTVINDEKSEELVAEVTFHKTKNNHRTMDWDPYRETIPTFVNDESATNLMNDSDLVDVARNSRSSIKSVYFPPNLSDSPSLPNDFATPKKHQRVSTDVEALLKIDYELSPLRYQYSEIIGKTRALGLNSLGFDLGISCRLDRTDTFDRFVPSPNESNYLLNRDQAVLRRAATSCNLKNRSGLVDNTWPSPTFSMVGKPSPTGSRTSCLNDSSNGRQKVLSRAIRDLSRTVESLNGLRSCDRVRKNASYLPATNSHASEEETVSNKRFCDKCISNKSFQSSPKGCENNAVIKGAISMWDGWSVHESVNTNPSNVFCRTEYNSHRYLNQTVENSRTSGNNFFQVRKQESSVFIMIDDDWPIVDEETTNKHFEILPDDRNSMAIQTEPITCNSNHRENILPERLVKNNRISSPFESKLIDRCTSRDRQLSRAVSASTCAPQIGVNLNRKFCTTVEKHYTNRAVSPLRNLLSTTTSLSNNVLLAASVSSIFLQQVDSRTEVVKIEPPSEIHSVKINKKNDAAVETCKRDFCVQKVDSQRENGENLSRKNQADLTTQRKRAQRLRLSKEKITIVPIVLTDGIPQSPRIADVDFAIPKYINKIVPQLNYQFAPFEARKSRRMPSSSSRDNEISQRNSTASAYLTDKLRSVDEKCWRTHATSISDANRSSLYTQEDYAPSNVVRSSKRPTRVTTSNARVGEKMREYCKSVAKAIPGMRSSPEDFLCET
ncbi:uncharacterized protein [Anoplolepis gracilipes]|uniref:uncharacterized protein n=1 Tax=Anoplolepis gracilipes TaxID=354296 RepID=UPI003B9FFABB